MTQPRLALVCGSTSRASRPRPTPAGIPGHDVQFYEGDEFLVNVVANFLADGIRAGQPHIVIATESHRRDFAQALRSLGYETDELFSGREVVWLDARQTLGAFMEGGMPSRELFMATVGNVFERVLDKRTYLVVRAYGEMVDLLWKDGNVEGAIALEELWNELAIKYSFSLLCAYSMGSFFKETHTESFRRICSQHSHTLPTEAFIEADDDQRLKQVTLWQQRAKALETEIVHRKELEVALRDVIAHRRRVEDALRRREAELQDFLDNAPEGMHWVGADGIVIWANRAELEMLGYEKHEVIGKHIGQFHADAAVIADMLERLLRDEVLREFEARLLCKDGSIRHVLINSNVYREDGRFVHTRCFTRDITHLKQSSRAS